MSEFDGTSVPGAGAPVGRRTALRAVGAGLLSVPWLAGCGRAGGKELKLAFVPKALNNPVFEITRAGAEDRARERGDVAVRWIGPATGDAGAQSQIIDDLVVQGVDGICLSCNDPGALTPAIDRAVAEGVSVVTWDSDAPRSRRLTNIGIDQAQAGGVAGTLMAKLAKPGKVAILTGSDGALNLQQRKAGFLKALATNPALDVAAIDPCNDDVQRAVEIVEQRINATAGLTGYFFVGMWPFFADLKTMPQLRAFVSGGGTCISLDALAGALDAVEQGYATALVGYSWYGFGRTAVDVLVDHIRGGVRPPDPMNGALFTVDRTNIAEYQQRQRSTNGHF